MVWTHEENLGKSHHKNIQNGKVAKGRGRPKSNKIMLSTEIPVFRRVKGQLEIG